jgi:hypothetical protein
MTEPAAPQVSVVVPVRNRRVLLRRLLDALAAQTFTDFELIVVDDGSTDGSSDAVESGPGAGLSGRVIPNPGVGALDARRAGVACARAPVLAFTDSDCVPDSGWLAAGVAALMDGADVVNGPTLPVRPVRPLDRSVASGEEGLYPTCNVFYRRSAYDAAGGFDTGLGARLGFRGWTRARSLGFGEDTVLAWHVRRAGRAAYAPKAHVEHEVFPPDLVDKLSRTVQMAAFPALLREVPELRHTGLVRHGVFLGNASRVPVYVAVVGLVGRRRALTTAALASWLLLQARDARLSPAPLSRNVVALPIRLVLDTVAAVALIVGSVRNRTLVL